MERSTRAHLLVLAFVVVATLAVFRPVLRHDFDG
jgi:hypothetical protein